MAPFKILTKKEISLKQKPWISPGILKSMHKRDKIYKDIATEIDPNRRDKIQKKYKTYRNKIIILTRKSKKKTTLNIFSNTMQISRKPGKA